MGFAVCSFSSSSTWQTSKLVKTPTEYHTEPIHRYCSLTHNTQPIIRTSELEAQTFAPLHEAEPQLQTLIDLVAINGFVIEQSHRHGPGTGNDIDELEARIGDLCSRQISPMHDGCNNFRTAYEPLARIHMLWYGVLITPIHTQ